MKRLLRLPWKWRQNWLGSAYHSVERWIAYRTYDKYHVVKCDGLKPNYHELETRLLHSAFGLLKEFVELQCAQANFDDALPVPSRESGMIYLDWASKLTFDKDYGMALDDPRYNQLTPQAEAAIKTRALYLWWVDERPNRRDPWVVSGYQDCDCEKLELVPGRDAYRMVECQHSNAQHEAYAKINALEEQYDAEDTTMLKRLCDLRRALWT